MIKTNLKKYTNPNLPPGEKNRILSTLTEYLNGGEFARAVTAPTIYKGPDFVTQMEAGVEGLANIQYGPHDAQERYVVLATTTSPA